MILYLRYHMYDAMRMYGTIVSEEGTMQLGTIQVESLACVPAITCLQKDLAKSSSFPHI